MPLDRVATLCVGQSAMVRLQGPLILLACLLTLASYGPKAVQAQPARYLQLKLSPSVLGPGEPGKVSIAVVDQFGKPASTSRMTLNITITSLGDFQLAKIQWVKEVAEAHKIRLLDWPRKTLPLKIISSLGDLQSWDLPPDLHQIISARLDEGLRRLRERNEPMTLDASRTTEFRIAQLVGGELSLTFNTRQTSRTLGFLVEAEGVKPASAFMGLRRASNDRRYLAEGSFMALGQRVYAAAAEQAWPVTLKFARAHADPDTGTWIYFVSPVIQGEDMLSTPCDLALGVDRPGIFIADDERQASSLVVTIPAGGNQPERHVRLTAQRAFKPGQPGATATVRVESRCPQLVGARGPFEVDFPPAPRKITSSPQWPFALANGLDSIPIDVSVVDVTGSILSPNMEGKASWVLTFVASGGNPDRKREEVAGPAPAFATVALTSRRAGHATLTVGLTGSNRVPDPEPVRVEFRDPTLALVMALVIAAVLAFLFGWLGWPKPFSWQRGLIRALVAAVVAFIVYTAFYYLVIPEIAVAKHGAKFLIEPQNIPWHSIVFAFPVGGISALVAYADEAVRMYRKRRQEKRSTPPTDRPRSSAHTRSAGR